MVALRQIESQVPPLALVMILVVVCLAMVVWLVSRGRVAGRAGRWRPSEG